jgi:hypothetical protein
VNVRPPAREDAAALRDGVTRLAALHATVPALLAALLGPAELTLAEREALAARDAVRGRRVVAPVAGSAVGIAPSGALLVAAADASVHEIRQTTVVYAE